MLILISILVVNLLAVSLARRLTDRHPTHGAVTLEMFLTATLSYGVALLLWWWLQPASWGLTLLVWVLMFVSGVVGIRVLGQRLTKLRQRMTAAQDFRRFIQTLAYHAATFWQLALIIGLATSLAAQQIPALPVLVGFSLVLTVAILLENAVRFAALTDESL